MSMLVLKLEETVYMVLQWLQQNLMKTLKIKSPQYKLGIQREKAAQLSESGTQWEKVQSAMAQQLKACQDEIAYLRA